MLSLCIQVCQQECWGNYLNLFFFFLLRLLLFWYFLLFQHKQDFRIFNTFLFRKFIHRWIKLIRTAIILIFTFYEILYHALLLNCYTQRGKSIFFILINQNFLQHNWSFVPSLFNLIQIIIFSFWEFFIEVQYFLLLLFLNYNFFIDFWLNQTFAVRVGDAYLNLTFHYEKSLVGKVSLCEYELAWLCFNVSYIITYLGKFFIIHRSFFFKELKIS